MKVAYRWMSAVRAGAAGVSVLVTMMFVAVARGRMTSLVRRSMSSEIRVTMRPTEAALVTRRGRPAGSFTTQLYAWWVCPSITASISGWSRLAISMPGPVTLAHPLNRVASDGVPPSCIRTTMLLTPFLLSSGTSALAVVTSLVNVSPSIPARVTMLGVFSRVMPMKATLAGPTRRMTYGGSTVRLVPS